ncbi:hypothetical protein [Bacillus cereus]|uniref:hypothetical protein n=1 Tax=Bacillus cereus TaxID=1396 RepID=UPI00027AA078|nr:hypothetical protein [Bacillus cereus]EJS63030.1 hypothetical protein ICU_04779 [Bacillus cereus BAG2X1-1]EJS69196.1 hypothetical protein ICY_04620 [Bacillus cereus BAG2X1-3]
MSRSLFNQIFHFSIKIIGYCIIAFSVTILVFNFTVGDQTILKGLNKNLGSLAEYGAIVAGSLWLFRNIWLYFHKKKIAVAKYIKELYMLLKQYHMFIGYAVLSVATCHGIYFLMVGSRHMIRIYSGIFTLIGLVLVAIVGILLHKLKDKKKYIKYRKAHQIVAIIFGIGLLIHLNV